MIFSVSLMKLICSGFKDFQARAVGPKLSLHQCHPGSLLKHTSLAQSFCLRQGPRIYIFSKFLGGTAIAGEGPHFQGHRVCAQDVQRQLETRLMQLASEDLTPLQCDPVGTGQ